MSRQVFAVYRATPSVSAFVSDEGRQGYPRVAIYHQEDQGMESTVSVASYITRDAARELARNLLAACDAIDLDEARRRNLSLALPGATT